MLENIPSYIRSLPQWVCACSDTKIPMQAQIYSPASSTDSSTWSTFDAALAAVSEGAYNNLGFVFADNGIVGIDIDTGFDEEGFMTPIAAKIINRCRSYTEVSRSGRGFHILVKGELPFKGKNNLSGVEIYRTARYFIMTGNVNLYSEIIENQEAIDFVVETYFASMRSTKEKNKYGQRVYSPIWPEPINGRVRLKPDYPQITCGGRNLSLASLAGSMHNTGYSFDSILTELEFVNETRCIPPLPTSEIVSIAKSITRYTR